MSATPDPPAVPASGDFSRNLIEAMRRVVEVSRDSTLAELRSSLEADTGQVDSARVERERGLRERADADVSEIGALERAEIERARAEALRRVQARQLQLEKEIGELDATAQAQRASLAARADDFERRVAAFMMELERIDDPAAFAAAARRMPSPTPVPAQASPAAAPPQSTAQPEQAPAAQTASATPTAEPATEPASESDAPGAPAVAGEGPAESEVSVMVNGLGSFGAITSFKQALERQEGIRGVTLSLGASGEFVFTVRHAADADLNAAIVAVEAGAQIAREGATLRVRVGVPTA